MNSQNGKNETFKNLPNPKNRYYNLFRYSNWFDKILITFGIIASAIAGAIYPWLFIFFGNVAQILVNYKIFHESNANTTFLNISEIFNLSLSKCANVNIENRDFDSQVSSIIRLLVLFGFISLILSYLCSFIWSLYGRRQTNRIKNMLFETLLRKEIQFFDKYTPGELNATITNNIKFYSDGIGDRFGDSIAQYTRFVVFIVLSFSYMPYITLVYLPIVFIVSGLAATMFIFSKKYTLKETKMYEAAGRIAQQALSSIRTVYAFSLQKKLTEKYENKLQNLATVFVKKQTIVSFFFGLVEIFIYSMFAISLLFGIYLLQTYCDQKNILGNITAASYCMWNSVFCLGVGLSFLSDLSQALAAAESLFEILDYKSVIDTSKDTGLKLDNFRGEIELNDVSFSYPQRSEAKILKSMSLKIEAGKTIAICGGSGGGKSTIIQLIQRFYDPNDGQVMLDGHDIKDLNINWLRSQMALVSQEPVLFATTIRENIRMGRLDATDEECEEAAKQANIHSFIVSNLKDGYDTYVGERGSQLSGGQKQRISIARALIRNPKILLLDEATSALDFESEKQVQQALDMAKIGRTTIIVAHRLSTIRNADLIIALKDGQVHEMGTHNQLIAKKGVYYELNIESMKTESELHMFITKEEPLQWTFNQSTLNENIENEENDEIDYLNKTSFKKKFSEFIKVQKFLWKFHLSDWFYLLAGIFGQFLNGSSVVIIVLLTVQVFNIATVKDESEQRRQSYLYGTLIFAIAFASMILNLVSSFSFSVSGARITKIIRKRMFESMMKQEIGWHDLSANQSSMLCMKLENTASLCKGATVDLVSIISRSISGIGFALIISIILNWKLTLVLFIFVPIILSNTIFYSESSYNASNNGKKELECGKLLISSIDSIRTIVSLGREGYFIEQFQVTFQAENPIRSLNTYKHAMFYSLMYSTVFFTIAANFSFGYQLIKNNELELINLFRVYNVVLVVTILLGRNIALLISTKKALQSALRAYKIITRRSLIDASCESGQKIENFKGSIEFHNVHFKYPTRNNKVLKGLNLKINENEMTGIVGRSGCGKSTIIQLLLRFYDVDEGKITLDGVDIRELNINWLRSQFGLVSQEPVLFDTTILENIQYGCDSDQDNVINVAKVANIHERIKNFPDKYETNVGHKGVKISIGEKQRIAIARAIIREPRILLLDEATSALDNESEKLVQIGLDNARMNRTCICIAHRLSTIEGSGKISVLENGRVLEEGTHDELMKNAKLYLNLQRSSSCQY